ncbi:hypothetical protein KUV85_03640 [Nocardioides panacisoli]|uniref:hypothetical protein n=1 Tax=Nocardioides panacisoli TaxID=627624 RepID=UPI001C63B49B|nr:hypothetical protein [Nocardioides panacisoli]QYJ04786.1 hypothetical protein KUV85_03640 [Nocardioides panacisoli]
MSTYDRTRALVPGWSVVLAVALLGPALAPGYVLSYDMVWVPDLSLRPDFLGLGSELPRAVPSDAVVAVLDELVPGAVLQKVVLLAALVGGGLGAARLVPDGLVPRLVAVGVYQWNPLVVERLVLGHWPVLVGYAVLPWVIVLCRRWRARAAVPAGLLLLVPLGSLSASAGLATAVVLVAAAAGRARQVTLVLLVAAANAPWVIAGLLHAGDAAVDPAGARVFALHDEGTVPGPVAALTLGGVWNSEVVPDTRGGLLGWIALVVLGGLAALGARSWWRRTERRERGAVLGCWVAGWATACATWVAPGAVGWLGEQVPGLGLLRDGARGLVLCAPLLVSLVGHGVVEARRRIAPSAVARSVTAATVVLLPVLLLPDAVWGVSGRVAAVSYPASYERARVAVDAAGGRAQDGDVVLLPLTSYRQPPWNEGRKVLDPWGRYLPRDYVAGDDLVVSGTVVAGEDPRVDTVREALARPTPEERSRALARSGIGIVVVDLAAPGGTDVDEVAGDRLAADERVVVIALRGVVDRGTPRVEATAMATAWTGPIVLLAVACSLMARRRRRG